MSAQPQSLVDLLDDAALHHGSSVALRVNARDLTYTHLTDLVGRCTSLLFERGVRPGSRVVLSAGNSAEFVAVAFATFRLGASVVLLSTSWRDAEAAYACSITMPTHIVHDGSGLVDLAAAQPQLPMVHIDEIADFEGAAVAPVTNIDLDDLAVMVFNSGTTDLPKAVRHSHRTLLAGTAHWIATLGLTSHDRLQIATPPFHILGLLNLTAVVGSAASVSLHRRFDLDTVLAAMEADRVTIEMAVAPIALAIANHPDLERFDLSSLRYIMWGATPVTASVAKTITRRTGVRVMPAYGASELPVLAVNPVHRPAEWRLDSVGLAPNGVELRVADPDTGVVLPAGVSGELQARSLSTMLGYLPDEANIDAFQDGWYRTGDVGHIDADGWVTITDRLKEMIKVAGSKWRLPKWRQRCSATALLPTAPCSACLTLDRECRSAVITGNGRAFSAGGDFHYLDELANDRALRQVTIETGKRLVLNMTACRVPVVAAVNGPAVGLGCSIVSLSDMVYMARSAHLADPHVVVGLVAADGGPITWPLHTSLMLAKEFAFTGDRITAERAAQMGLVNHVCDDGTEYDQALACAHRIAKLPQFAVESTKRVMNLHMERAVLATIDFALGAEYQSFDSPELRATLDKVLK